MSVDPFMSLGHPGTIQLSQSEQIKYRNPTQESLRYCIYDSFQSIRCLKREWDELAGRTGDILCSYDWCEIWWQHFGRWRRLEIHTFFDANQLVAVLPLFHETIRQGGLWLRTVRVLGCDYTISTVGLAVEPAYVERFIQRLLDQLDQQSSWDILQIGPLRSYCSTIESVASVCADAPSVQNVIVGRQDNWCTIFHLPKTYEQFVQSLPKTARGELLRRERRLQEHHQVDVEIVSRPEQVKPAMDALIQLHQKRWTDKGQPGQLRDPSVRQFHHELAQRLVTTGQLVLLLLRVDDQVVSTSYGYRFGSRIHGLFVGHCYDGQWVPYGLGRLMHSYLVRWAISQGVTILESGRGIFPHKLQLGGKLYGERSLVVVRRGWSTRLRFWGSLRAAYLIHVLYSRFWTDMIASRLGLAGLVERRHVYIRNNVLLQLFRRVRFGLFGGPKVLGVRRLAPRSQPKTS